MWHKCIKRECSRAGRQFNQTSDDTGSALEKCRRVNKATWTGLQRGSSMSRFLLVGSLVAVGSSVLLYVIGLIEKNGRKIRSSSWFRLATSSVRRDAGSSCSPFLPFLLPPAPFRSLCHLYPFSASLLPPWVFPLRLSLLPFSTRLARARYRLST